MSNDTRTPVIEATNYYRYNRLNKILKLPKPKRKTPLRVSKRAKAIFERNKKRDPQGFKEKIREINKKRAEKGFLVRIRKGLLNEARNLSSAFAPDGFLYYTKVVEIALCFLVQNIMDLPKAKRYELIKQGLFLSHSNISLTKEQIEEKDTIIVEHFLKCEESSKRDLEKLIREEKNAEDRARFNWIKKERRRNNYFSKKTIDSL